MFIKLYIIALIIFLIIDGIWLGFIGKNYYQEHIGFLMKTNINWVSALIFYLIFIVGLVVFVIQPGIEGKSISKLLITGSLFGLVTYSTYDLTNLATIKDWPLNVTIIDLIWGTFVSTAVSFSTFLIANKFLLSE